MIAKKKKVASIEIKVSVVEKADQLKCDQMRGDDEWIEMEQDCPCKSCFIEFLPVAFRSRNSKEIVRTTV